MTVSKFKVGDRVYAPFHDCGIVTKITNDDTYPIEVTWEVSRYKYGDDISTFTPDGFLSFGDKRAWTRITQVGKALEGDSKFHVGDRVSFPHHGLGTVIADHNDGRVYPIEVKWDNNPLCQDISSFTPDGLMVVSMIDDDDKLTLVGSAISEEDEGVVERMEDALSKKVDDAINPSHYKVKGISEAHEIINHLMHREQYEGFLWGNILKYAYRYGRKGDKAETAGKIAWYATQLKELEEEKRK